MFRSPLYNLARRNISQLQAARKGNNANRVFEYIRTSTDFYSSPVTFNVLNSEGWTKVFIDKAHNQGFTNISYIEDPSQTGLVHIANIESLDDAEVEKLIMLMRRFKLGYMALRNNNYGDFQP